MSLQSGIVAAVSAAALRPLVEELSPTGFQLRLMRAVTFGIGGGLLPTPRHAHVAHSRIDSVPGLWARAEGVSEDADVVLYLHGGGYVLGSPRAYRSLALRLSAASGTAVFVPKYRLAPEHPFPAAADDALDAYRALIASGVAPDRLALAGDSAGAHLVCTLLGDISRSGLPMPAGAVLMSPALDWTGSSATARDAIERDPLVSPRYGAKCGHAYVGGNVANPRLALLDAELASWPPILIQVGGTECLRDDATRLADTLSAAGVPCELQVWPGQVHVFQGLAAVVPEARAAIAAGGRFLAGRLGADRRAA
ncbi:alpha/beta hydrolase [Nocardia fluminea]|uniref:alpha/beta hydrolase n=1 Tax=Nocardia fluminea TaxID=134984 RepID=UPI0033DD73B0